jgi:hypothetical protein
MWKRFALSFIGLGRDAHDRILGIRSWQGQKRMTSAGWLDGSAT